jgi:transcriptional regulator with XRE-family HTH domain
MDDREPTIRSRTLGEGLRRAMLAADISGKAMAERIGCSQGHVSRLLSGKRGATVEDVTSVLTLCGMKKGAERSYLLSLCEDPHTPGWLQQHGSRLPKQVRVLVDHEDLADYYGTFEPVVLPGLLQTGDYARAIMLRNVNLPAAEIDERVRARLARQEVFSRQNPARFEFFIHEWVLRTPVGGRDVMCDQLHHLLRTGVRDYVTIRVVPAALGAHTAMSGAFILLRFPHFRPVVYLDSESSCLFLEQPDEVAAYRNLLAGLGATSLGEGQSRDLIAELAGELSADREDRDERG